VAVEASGDFGGEPAVEVSDGVVGGGSSSGFVAGDEFGGGVGSGVGCCAEFACLSFGCSGWRAVRLVRKGGRRLLTVDRRPLTGDRRFDLLVRTTGSNYRFSGAVDLGFRVVGTVGRNR